MGIRATIVVLALLATGCGANSAGGGGDGVQGKVFTSTSSTRTLVEGTKIELRFTADGTLNANAGCNQMQGPVTTDGGKLAVADLSTTDMACPTPGAGEQDAWLSKLLTAQPSWKLDGTNLVITGSDAEVVLVQQQPATLEGKWIVEGAISADAVESMPEGSNATLEFKDGFIFVTGDCNSGSTKVSNGDQYEVDGQTITFGELAVTAMMCPPDKMAAESAMLTALGRREVTFQIEGTTMTLTNADGKGVQLRR
ncbi:META domain-containing protein [Lentzea sp. JNUCC 0626]|uniref:META domain-containing protein n=1 Tax=Lentzea sp. JNUCC 0626 TaxID=3367513 RepID=UPI0037480F27